MHNQIPGVNQKRIIRPNALCAVKPSGGGSCYGDSGGPLMSNFKGKTFAIGIVSWGIKCGDPNTPGVYTRVDPYLSWIKENTKDSLDCSLGNSGHEKCHYNFDESTTKATTNYPKMSIPKQFGSFQDMFGTFNTFMHNFQKMFG